MSGGRSFRLRAFVPAHVAWGSYVRGGAAGDVVVLLHRRLLSLCSDVHFECEVESG